MFLNITADTEFTKDGGKDHCIFKLNHQCPCEKNFKKNFKN